MFIGECFNINGYPIAAEALDLEIYKLYCLYTSSSILHGLVRQFPNINWLLETFEQSELSKKIISIAVIIRNQEDTRITKKSKDSIVGELIPDEHNPINVEKLNLREACNKIVHALDINFQPGIAHLTETTPLSEIMEFGGEFRGKNWIAKIDILKFLEAICNKT